MRAIRFLLIAAALLAARAWGGDIDWEIAAGADKPPAGWDLHAAADAKAAVRFERGELALTVAANRFCHVDRQLKSLDGTDESPLRVECAMAVDSGAAVDAHPALLALYWSPDNFVAIGLGDGGEREQPGRAWRNRAWIGAAIGGKVQRAPADGWFFPGPAPGHVRLVVTAHAITAYASGDGWNWSRVGSFARSGALGGPPERVILGRGWTAEKDAKPTLDNDPPGAKPDVVGTYRFSDLLISTAPANVPASLMKSYEKRDSRDDTLDAIAAPGAVKQWQVLGPLPPSDKPYPPETQEAATPLAAVNGVEWKPFTPGESPTDRIIALSDVAKGMGADAVRYAAASFTLDAPRAERFLFDGMKDVRVYVDGREIAQDRRDQGEVVIDRLSAVARLGKGEHRVVVRVGARQDGRALFAARHENGEALYRIALLKRLAIDFPDDSAGAATQLEIARLWEGLGYQREAANALDEVAHATEATAEQVDQALVERARLHHELADDARVSQDVDELIKRWGETSDPVAARLKAAHLWERLDQPEKAAAALDQAAGAAASDPERQLEIGTERARVHERLKDAAAVTADLRATAKRLPDDDPRRSELYALAAARELRASRDPAADLAAANANPSPTALRLLAAIAGSRGDAAARLAALKRLAAVAPTTSVEAPRVALAEALAAGGDLKAAAEEYRAAIAASAGAAEPEVQAKLKAGAGADAKALAALRSAWLRACIADTAAGHGLLDEIAKVQSGAAAKPLPSEVRGFQVCGPFDNNGWRCYEQAWLDQAVHPTAGKVDTGKAIEGKAWIAPKPEAWSNGILDLMRVCPANNCCAFAYAEVAADGEGETQLSMGADDGLVVWFNGEKVHEDRDQRGVTPDSILVPVKFRKGVNTILLMIQQGGGGWGYQMRIVGGSAIGDVAGALRVLDEHPEARVDIARGFIAGMEGLARGARYAQAAAVARAAIRAFPDVTDQQFGAAWRFEELARANGDGQALTDLPAFFDGSPESVRADVDGALAGKRLTMAETVGAWGAYEACADGLRRLLRSYFDASTQALTLRALGDVYRRGGYARQAGAAYARAERTGYTDQWFGPDLRERMSKVRSLKGEKVPLETSFDANALLRTAERAGDGGDLDRALTSYQRALDDFGPQMCVGADGRPASVSAYATARMRALGADAVAAYRQRFDARAKALLDEADAGGTADAYERVAAQYPLSSSAAVALERAADAYLDLGAWDLARATLERALAEQPDAPGHEALQAKAARAAARQGKPQALPEPALAAASPLATFALPANDLHDLRRIAWIKDGPVLCRPTVANGTLFLHTLDGAFAIDLAKDELRWRDRLEFPALREARHAPGFAGTPETRTGVWGRWAIARVLRGGNGVLEARDAASGELLWSTEGLPTLSGMSAVSSPAAADGRAYAIFTDHSRAWLGAFALADGRLLWMTQITPRRPAVPLVGDAEIALGGHAAAPTVVGREIYLATDLGTVLRLDAGSGAIAWIATYARGLVDAADGAVALAQLATRAPTRVLVDDERVYVAPRDSLGVIAFARADGALAWTRELLQCRQLAGMTESEKGGRRLILQGGTLDALEPRTGARLWRWEPRSGDGPTVGTAAFTGASAYVATPGGLTRVALADGATAEFHAWKDLGWNGPVPGNLLLTQNGLLGVGDGVVALIGAARAGQNAQPVAVPGGLMRDTPIPGADLPAAPPGSPLGAAWRIGGDAVESIDRPDGCPDNECFVRFQDSIARIDVAARVVRWRAPLSSDVRWTAYTKDLVIAGHRFGLTAYDRATGAPRWYADIGEGPIESLRDDVDGRAITVGDSAVLVYRVYWNRAVDVYSLADGHRVGRYEIDGGVLAATERGGSVFTAFRRDDGVFIDERALDKLALPLKRHEGIKASDRDGATVMPGNGSLIVHNRAGAARFDFASKQAKPYPLAFFYGGFYREDGKDLAMVYTPKDNWISAVLDPATDQVLFQEVTAGGGGWDKLLFAYHYARGKVARIEWDRKGKNGVMGKTVTDGKEIWYVPGREGWVRRYHGVAMLDKYVVALSTQAEGVFTYDLIDGDSGAVVASGRAPGYPDEGAVPLSVIAGQVVYGTRQGLFALAPTTADAAASPPGGAAPISLQSMSRLSVLNAPGPIVIDGQLDEWKSLEPVELWQAQDVRADGGPGEAAHWTGPKDCAAGVRLCWDSTYVYAAIRVLDDRRREPVPGASLVTGDSVLLAIDPQEDRFRGSQPYVVGLSVIDGKPAMTTSGGVGGENAERPTMRAAIGAEGATYEVAIPWAQLRGNPEKRPGDLRAMRVGVLVVDRDGDADPDALEVGYGLANGFDQTLWRPCLIATDKERSITGMAFSLFGGRATWGHAGRIVHPGKKDKTKEKEEAWLGDEFPKGANPAGDGGDSWTWVKKDPEPPPGTTQVHQSAIAAAEHQHYFQDGPMLKLKPGDTLFAWVYLDPANPPSEVMLQFNKGGSWEHRAYWGENKLEWGGDGSEARHYMGPLPKAGGWVRLEVPAEVVGLD